MKTLYINHIERYSGVELESSATDTVCYLSRETALKRAHDIVSDQLSSVITEMHQHWEIEPITSFPNEKMTGYQIATADDPYGCYIGMTVEVIEIKLPE